MASTLSFIKNAINQVTSALGFNLVGPDQLYPTDNIKDINNIYDNDAPFGMGGTAPNNNFDKDLGYGFAVLDENNGNNIASGWKAFRLQINPQSLQQDETFSIEFFPTPTGIVVEHQGSIMKDIVISGVTGVHPKRGAGGVDIKGDLIFGMGESGYKQFHDLRNYIRAYIEHKKDSKNASLRMAFFNFKDNEFFIVEPTRFSLKRSDNRPLLYEYTIALKTIGRTSKADFLDDNIFSQILGKIDRVAALALNALRVARGTLLGSIALLESVDRYARSKIFDPLREIDLAIDDYVAGRQTFINIPRKFIKDLQTTLREIGDKLADKVGVNTTAYNRWVDRIPFVSTTGTITTGTETATLRTPTDEDRAVLNAINKMIVALDKVAFNGEYFSESSNATANTAQNIYNRKAVATIEDPINQTADTPVITTTANVTQSKPLAKTFATTKTVQILQGQTIQDIAAAQLGDASRFTELVILNNLKYPYITEPTVTTVLADGTIIQGDVSSQYPGSIVKETPTPDGVLSTNSKILIPDNSSLPNIKIQNIYKNIDYEITKAMSTPRKNLGVDIALGQNNDLAITNTQDFDLVAAEENVIQQIGIRLGVDKGGYKIHTSFGVNLAIGQKNVFGATLIKQEIETQLFQDPRIDKKSKVIVNVNGDVVSVNIYAKIKGTGQNLPLQLVSNS